MDEIITCKLVFKHGAVSVLNLPSILRRYTEKFDIIHFYPESEIGINKVTVAVVDLPRNVVPQLWETNLIKDTEIIADNDIKHADDGSGCSKGSCGSGCGSCS